MNKKTHIADLTTCFFHTSADNQKNKKKLFHFCFGHLVFIKNIL